MDLLNRARILADDHDSGAAELTARLLGVLADALRADGDAVIDVARIVLQGQPAMAPLWHACGAAVIESERPGTFARARAEMERAPSALVRAASLALVDLFTGDASPRLVTLSYSSSVARVLRELATSTRLRVVCAEGRPRYEGRRLAVELAQAGVEVTAVVDAALTTHLPGASAVVMGADAVTADYWINKVGSAGVAAVAALRSVPVYVIAARDKFVPPVLAHRLESPRAAAEEVWSQAPANIVVENAYFEAVPAHLATLVLTDIGPVTPADFALVAERQAYQLSHLLSFLR